MELYFAHKSFLGKVTRAKEDCTIITFNEEIPVMKDELILEHLNGDKQVITDARFEEYYVPLTVQPKEKTLSNSSFAELYAQQIQSFEGMLNSTEDELYINDDLLSNKAL